MGVRLLGNAMEIKKTEEWHEDDGDCLFIHFATFQEPPDTYCGTPLDELWYRSGGEKYWTHFIVIDWNAVIEKIQSEGK